MKGHTYFKKFGFSINEGAGPANIHVSWGWPSIWFYFYIFIIKWRFHIIIRRNRTYLLHNTDAVMKEADEWWKQTIK